MTPRLKLSFGSTVYAQNQFNALAPGLEVTCTIEFEAWAATLRFEICQFKALALKLKLEMINLMLGLQGPGLNCSMLRLRPQGLS